MRAGADRLLNIVGASDAHHGYLFANLRATRIKLLLPEDSPRTAEFRAAIERAERLARQALPVG